MKAPCPFDGLEVSLPGKRSPTAVARGTSRRSQEPASARRSSLYAAAAHVAGYNGGAIGNTRGTGETLRPGKARRQRVIRVHRGAKRTGIRIEKLGGMR